MTDLVVDVLRRYGLADRFTPDRFAPTVGASVDEVTGTLRGDIEGTKWDGNGPERPDGPERPGGPERPDGSEQPDR